MPQLKSCNFIPETRLAAQLKSLEGKFLNKWNHIVFFSNPILDRSHHLEDQSF